DGLLPRTTRESRPPRRGARLRRRGNLPPRQLPQLDRVPEGIHHGTPSLPRERGDRVPRGRRRPTSNGARRRQARPLAAVHLALRRGGRAALPAAPQNDISTPTAGRIGNILRPE